MSSDKTFAYIKPLFDFDIDGPLVVAGPCSAESAEQVAVTARGVADCGLRVFRAGAWKPRTQPGQFEGMGEKALPWIRKACAETGLIPMVEVATSSHLFMALRAGIKAFWIGARTSANPFAVQEIADTLAALPTEKHAEITMLVKNPANPDLELWIGALQRIYRSGVRRLGAVLRGFSMYGEHRYRNVPEWRIAFELHRRIPQLPILCDPSHISGERDMVEPLSHQALSMGFDGLIIETHCNPAEALSDSAQQITPAQLNELIRSIGTSCRDSEIAGLDALRAEIDDIDDALMAILARRMKVAREIGRLKREANVPVVQPIRYKKLMEERLGQAEAIGISDDFIRKIFGVLHEESVRQQIEIQGK